MRLVVDHRLRTHKPVFTVVGRHLQLAQPAALVNQVSPGVLGIFLISPLLDSVVFDLIKLTGVEVQAVDRNVVSELLANNQALYISAMQLGTCSYLISPRSLSSVRVCLPAEAIEHRITVRGMRSL
jgi:hypothetical protein